MNNRLVKILQLFLVVLDFIVLNTIYLLLRVVYNERITDDLSNYYFEYWIVLNVNWFLLSWISEVYSEKMILSFEIFSKRTLRTYVLWFLCILFYLFFFRKFLLSRYFVVTSLLFLGLGLFISRFIYIGVRGFLKSKSFSFKNVIIIGYNELAKKLAYYFENEEFGVNIIGYVEDTCKVKELSNYPILSDIENAIPVSEQLKVNEIFSTITPEQDTKLYTIMKEAESACIRFKFVPDLSMFLKRPIHIDYIRDLPILSIRSEPLDDISNRIKKRLLDLVVSSLVIVFVLSWLVPILGLIILIESPGPIFFKQARTGRDKKSFQCLKFRSMRSNAESDTKQASKHDSRITAVGRFIRKTSIDEFPQFFNVFRGEMSLVGPRPHMLKHTEFFSKITEHYMIRQFLKPGITGWAQINGYRGEVTKQDQIEKRVEYDLWYMENWNLWLDIKILFLTIYKILKGDKMAF
jgi:putative colanic acid biosynthesis UDP-glucose lipid carrier transferase